GNLVSALTNILDNAADASPSNVAIEAGWDERALQICVADRGQGLEPNRQDRAGKSVFSDKPNGYGLGLDLAFGIIERMGGELSLRQRTGGGTAADIRLPLAGLKI